PSYLSSNEQGRRGQLSKTQLTEGGCRWHDRSHQVQQESLLTSTWTVSTFKCLGIESLLKRSVNYPIDIKSQAIPLLRDTISPIMCRSIKTWADRGVLIQAWLKDEYKLFNLFLSGNVDPRTHLSDVNHRRAYEMENALLCGMVRGRKRGRATSVSQLSHIQSEQVEQRKKPHLRGHPTAVVQYNSWKGGGLIAVSYEARKYGVKRSMRGDEAKQVCPQIQLVQVPVARGKADLSIYRNAGSEVVSILARKGRCERASIDEVYLDLTDAAEAMLAETPPESLEKIDEEALKSHVLGFIEGVSDIKENAREWLCRSDTDHRDKLLACGALIVAELRMQVLKETEFTCSAGVAHNKMLAKLASGMNKPAQQTVVPLASVKGLLEPLPIKKMKQLGGKLGSSLQIDLGVSTVGDLLKFSEEKLQEQYGINTGTWLWNIARGISGEEVEGRLLPKSHGSGKTFPGRQALKTIASVEHWLNELCEELSERLHSDLDQNKRIAHTLTLHASGFKSSDTQTHKNFPSKSCPLRYGTSKIKEDALNLFQAGLREYLGSHRIKTKGSQKSGWGITALSVSASKILAIPSGTSSIMKYFHSQDQPSSSSKQVNDTAGPEAEPVSPSGTESYSGSHQTEPPMEFHEDETRISCALPCLDQQENKREESTSKVCF
ncbi:DNA-directed DNA polymerase, partial [Sarracenia purpurea var. burkii]